MRRIAGLACVFLTMWATPAAAGNVLTEEDVRAVYLQMKNSYALPFEEHFALIKKHTPLSYRGAVTGTLTVPGLSPMPINHVISYDDLIKDAQNGYDSMKSVTSTDYKVTAVTIAPDGRSAKVSDVMKVQRLTLKTPQQVLTANSEGTCNDEIILNDADVIQVVKSACAVQIEVIPERDL